MFDTYRVNTNPSSVHVSVTEQRAPTDESVKLLREMERTAAKQVLESVRVANTNFECVIHRLDSHLNARSEFVAVLKVNGKQMIAKYVANDMQATAEDVAVGIRDAVAQEIANLIAPALTREVMRGLTR